MGKQKFKKRFWVTLGLLLFVVLVVAGGSIAYLAHLSTASATVCAGCHPDVFDQWKNSKGHPAHTTSCFQCHSNHIIPSGYSADDPLTTERCLDCHEDVLELGYAVKKKVVKYNHRIHRQEGLECIACHRSAGHEDMPGGTNRPTISECLPCHFKEFNGPPKNQKCLNCHDVMLVPGRMWKND